MARIVFIQSQKDRGDESPPLNKKYHHKLRQLKINPNFCKQISECQNSTKDKDEKCFSYEHPNCFLCLKDISIGEDAILLRCGHLFHKNCILDFST